MYLICAGVLAVGFVVGCIFIGASIEEVARRIGASLEVSAKMGTSRTEIAALVNEFRELYDGDLSNEAVSFLLTNLEQI